MAWNGAKINQWRNPARKILFSEPMPTLVHGHGLGYVSPLAPWHGTSVFHGDVPGTPEMLRGTVHGSNVSAVFLDGHAQGVDQDFTFSDTLFDPLAP
jgi:prepilin-type processing-associated H-X9-DG protein